MQSRTVLLIGAMAVFVAANVLILGYALQQSQSEPHRSVAQADGDTTEEGEERGAAAADPAALKVAMDRGKLEYGKCLACHGPDGKGMQVGPTKMAPSLVGSEIALGDPDRAALVVLKGIKKESNDFTGIMAPLQFDDEGLAAVLTYVRNSFGNEGSMVTPEEAAAARTRFASTPALISRSQIDSLMAANARVSVESVAVATDPGRGTLGSMAEALFAPPPQEPWVPIEGIAVVGGRVPHERPKAAPVVDAVAAKDDQWYANATHGLPGPHPANFRFLEDQGNWFTPFTRPGMTGPYDMRHWHHE